MAAYLQPGDKILLAVPDTFPSNTITEDRTYWNSVYAKLGVEIHHLSVDDRLTHAVVIAVLRDEVTTAEVDPA